MTTPEVMLLRWHANLVREATRLAATGDPAADAHRAVAAVITLWLTSTPPAEDVLDALGAFLPHLKPDDGPTP